MNILRLTLIQIMKDYQSYILRNEELLLLEESREYSREKAERDTFLYCHQRSSDEPLSCRFLSSDKSAVVNNIECLGIYSHLRPSE